MSVGGGRQRRGEKKEPARNRGDGGATRAESSRGSDGMGQLILTKSDGNR